MVAWRKSGSPFSPESSAIRKRVSLRGVGGQSTGFQVWVSMSGPRQASSVEVGGGGPDLERALLAVDHQVDVVGLAGGVAAHVDDAEGAVAELHGHRDAVVHVEAVDVDHAALGLVEGAHPGVQRHDVEAGAVGDEVEDVHADVAEHALGAVRGGEPPEPALLGAPVAPVAAGEPGLQVGGLDVADLADLAGEHHLAGELDRGGVAVGEVDHVDEAARPRRPRSSPARRRGSGRAASRRRPACRRR